MNSLYTIPFHCEALMSKRRQPTCELVDSIRQHIHLIFRTHFKEYRYDQEFGSLVWEKDFVTIRSIHKWKNELTESFYHPLINFEKRITQVRLDTNLDELKMIDQSTHKVIEVRRRIIVSINAVILKTNEPFQHNEHIFFSPLSMT